MRFKGAEEKNAKGEVGNSQKTWSGSKDKVVFVEKHFVYRFPKYDVWLWFNDVFDVRKKTIFVKQLLMLCWGFQLC